MSLAVHVRKHPGRAARSIAMLRLRALAIDEGYIDARDDGEAARLRQHIADLERALNEVGRCRRCGRTLTDRRSVERGIGPDCEQEERAVEGSPTASEEATP